MANIIIRKKGHNWQQRKDMLHKRRKELSEKMKDGMFSTSQMKKGTDGIISHEEQVAQYDKWKADNEKRIREWSDINKEFKKQGEEGRVHSVDDIRDNKVKYD